MKEIITLQFGHIANFVGAHYWNIQDELFNLYGEKSEIDSNFLYRYGQTPSKLTTCTPRVMIFDAKGSLGSLKQEGSLYNPDNVHIKEEMEFHGQNYEYQEIDTVPKIDFIKKLENREKITREARDALSKDVRVWSDFLIPHLHPKSIQILKSRDHKDKFNVYTDGDVLKNQILLESTLESLNFFVEECDSLQGFQIFTNSDDAWAKMSADMIDLIRDEVGLKYSVFTFGIDKEVIDSGNEDHFKDLAKKGLNEAFATVDLVHKSNLYVPLTSDLLPRQFSHLNLIDNQYQRCSILASAIDSATLSYRRKNTEVDMRTMQKTLNTQPAMRLSALSTTMPFLVEKKSTLFDILSKANPLHLRDDLVSLSPGFIRSKNTSHPFSKVNSIRGVTSIPIFPEIDRFGNNKSDFEYYAHSKTHQELFTAYCDRTKSYYSDSYVFSQGSPCSIAFPDFFEKHILEDGTFDPVNERQDRVISYPQLSAIETTKESVPFIVKNRDTLIKFKANSRHEYNYNQEDIEDYREHLYRFSDDYDVNK